MAIGLGLAVAHSPLYYRPRETWEDIYRALIGATPQDTRADIETSDLLDEYEARMHAAFDSLSAKLAAYSPEALVMIVSDTGRVFSRGHVPQISVFAGEEIWGTTHYEELGEKPQDDSIASIAVKGPLALWLADELTLAGFDLNYSQFFKPLGKPADGAPHTLTDPYLKIAGLLQVPVIPVFVNAHVDPAIKGHRVLKLGAAIQRVLAERPERIAILGVGGLTGDPGGYLAGWIDTSLDDWVLSRFKRGRSSELCTLWDQESITLRGATREIRNWMVVAAAMEAAGKKANVVDYMRFHHACVGTAFAYWE